MKSWVWIMLWICTAWSATAQEQTRFRIEVAADTLLMGHPLEVSFVLEGAQSREFIPPAFDGFRLISGPNISSSISMMGGQVSRKVSYSYILEPIDPGEHWIQSAAMDTGEAVLETTPVAIQVLPNPGGVLPPSRERSRDRFPPFLQEDWMPMMRDTLPPKPQRKIYRL